MNIRIQSQGFSLTPAIAAWAHEQVGKALDRYADSVVSTDVYLKDVNGPKGGEDKQALVRIHLRYRAPVMVESTTGDLYAAISLTARRAQRAVRRALSRRQRLFRSDSRQLRRVQMVSADL